MNGIYGGRDPRHLAAYTVAEASRYVRVPPGTLHRWLHPEVGLIVPDEPPFMSFTNLVEAHVLAAMRRAHRVSMPRIRRALDYVRTRLDVERPLVESQFETDGIDLFLQELGALVNVSRGGQFASREMLDAHLSRIERDKAGIAWRLYPFVRSDTSAEAMNTMPKIVAIDPRVAFGRPVIAGTGIRVEHLAARYLAGDSIDELAHDYDLPPAKVEEAIRASLPAAA